MNIGSTVKLTKPCAGYPTGAIGRIDLYADSTSVLVEMNDPWDFIWVEPDCLQEIIPPITVIEINGETMTLPEMFARREAAKAERRANENPEEREAAIQRLRELTLLYLAGKKRRTT